MNPHLGDRTMIRLFRQTFVVTIVTGLLLAPAACSPASGPLGTPATPAVTPAPSGQPTPSDQVPGSPTPSVPATPVPSQPGTPSPTPAATPTPAPTGTTTIRAYFMLGSFTGNPGLAPVLRVVPATQAVATAAMNGLLAGPNAAELAASPAMSTSIPEVTRLLGLTIENKVATVNLSSEFAAVRATFTSGTATAQVVYTLTQFPTVSSVRIEVDGQSFDTATRADFQVQGIIPAIFMDRPAWGASIGNPARVGGLANVFEAVLQVQLRDADAGILADQQVMASCGTGCWGTFSVSLPYSVAKAQYGTLRVYSLSARDGSQVNVTEYQVWLTPAG